MSGHMRPTSKSPVKEKLPPITSKLPSKYRTASTLYSQNDLYTCHDEFPWVKPKQWDPSQKRNAMCEYCCKMLSYLDTIDACCRYCNVVAHITCVPQKERELVFQQAWVCPECTSDLKDSFDVFHHKRDSIVMDRKRKLSQIIIGKYWRRYLTRKRYKLFIKAIYHLQSLGRIIYRQHIFKEIRKLMNRPLKLHIISCDGIHIPDKLDGELIITVAVIDQSKRDKLCWYFEVNHSGDRNAPIFDDRVLLPGVSAIHTVVITLVLRSLKRTTFVGQSHVNLTENNYWKLGGRFDLTLDSPAFYLKEFGQLTDHDMSGGSVQIELEPLNGLRAECGSLFGPNLDSYLRIAYSIKRANGLKIVKAFSKAKLSSSNSSGGSSSGGGDVLSQNAQSRMWACVTDGLIYLYTRQGAALRAIVDLRLANLSFVLDSNGTTERLTVSLKMAGIPPLILSVHDPIESWRWKFAILNSYKYSRESLNNSSSLGSPTPGGQPGLLSHQSTAFDLYDHRADMEKLYIELSSVALRNYRLQVAQNEAAAAAAAATAAAAPRAGATRHSSLTMPGTNGGGDQALGNGSKSGSAPASARPGSNSGRGTPQASSRKVPSSLLAENMQGDEGISRGIFDDDAQSVQSNLSGFSDVPLVSPKLMSPKTPKRNASVGGVWNKVLRLSPDHPRNRASREAEAAAAEEKKERDIILARSQSNESLDAITNFIQSKRSGSAELEGSLSQNDDLMTALDNVRDLFADDA